MKSILDKDFAYVDSANTDLKKTFARIIAENKKKQKALKQAGVVTLVTTGKVQPKSGE
jgi:hypothetical protein